MPRRRRFDGDGAYFHVMNRGLSRRPVFESRTDARYFQSRIAKAVRREEIDLLAFVLMTNHYHLLIRSRGRLSEAMRRIQMDFVRWFNRSRGRDGPLFRGRFRAKHVRTRAYLKNVYCYIAENPVEARISTKAVSYPWSSAALLARARPPKWLSVEHIERLGLGAQGRAHQAASPEARRDRASLVERRMGSLLDDEDLLDDVLSPGMVLGSARWMGIAARLADGSAAGQPVAGIDIVIRNVERVVGAAERVCVPGSRPRDLRTSLSAGLLRALAGCTLVEIGRTLGTSRSTAGTLVEYHRAALEHHASYRSLAETVIGICLRNLR